MFLWSQINKLKQALRRIKRRMRPIGQLPKTWRPNK
jgi:hypothetical protein